MQLFANNAESTLAASINASVTTMVLATGDGSKFPNPTGGDFFLVTVLQKIGATEANWEIIKCTARSGDSLTIERGQDGTTAQVHAFGDVVSLRVTASAMATESRVRSTILTGLSVANDAIISATDTFLSALGKLQAQISSFATSISSMLDLKAPLASPSFSGLAQFAGGNRGTAVTVAASDIDLSLGCYFTKTLTGSTTFTVSNKPVTGKTCEFFLELTNGGGKTIVLPAGAKRSKGTALTLTTTGVDLLMFVSRDGGTTWTYSILEDVK